MRRPQRKLHLRPVKYDLTELQEVFWGDETLVIVFRCGFDWNHYSTWLTLSQEFAENLLIELHEFPSPFLDKASWLLRKKLDISRPQIILSPSRDDGCSSWTESPAIAEILPTTILRWCLKLECVPIRINRPQNPCHIWVKCTFDQFGFGSHTVVLAGPSIGITGWYWLYVQSRLLICLEGSKWISNG